MHDSIKVEVFVTEFGKTLMLKYKTVLNNLFFVGCDHSLPSNSKAKFTVDFDKILEEFSEKIDCLYLVGDMNIDRLKQDS